MITKAQCDELFAHFQKLDPVQRSGALARLFGHLDNKRKSRFGEQLYQTLEQIITVQKPN